VKVLVTGGQGFIGSHVVDVLLERGHGVTIYDRRLIRVPAGTAFHLGDVRDGEAFADAIGQHDGVIHLAGVLGTSEMVTTARESVEVNIGGALNLYEAVKRYGCRAVQIAVGNYTWNNSYAITKYTAERFALMYNKEFGTKIAVVRGLNAYGERQKHAPIKKVVPNFVLSALRDEPLVIFGDGEQLLDMIYVRDVAEILVRALELDHGQYAETMEAGSGELVTANHLATEIVRIAGSRSEIRHVPMRAGEPVRSITRGDPSTLDPIRYRPQTSLSEGLRRTVEWYRAHAPEIFGSAWRSREPEPAGRRA
jgi:nucleoside-diphosphate-sugar epimerase